MRATYSKGWAIDHAMRCENRGSHVEAHATRAARVENEVVRFTRPVCHHPDVPNLIRQHAESTEAQRGQESALGGKNG